jgi:hypothetical protein
MSIQIEIDPDPKTLAIASFISKIKLIVIQQTKITSKPLNQQA